jgi:hypothetical protein
MLTVRRLSYVEWFFYLIPMRMPSYVISNLVSHASVTCLFAWLCFLGAPSRRVLALLGEDCSAGVRHGERDRGLWVAVFRRYHDVAGGELGVNAV